MKVNTIKLIQQMIKDSYKPDMVVAHNPSGILIGYYLSSFFNAEFMECQKGHTIAWIPEDIVYDDKKVLVIDHQNNDDFFTWIKHDWESSIIPSEPLQKQYHKSVRFACVNKLLNGNNDIDYYVYNDNDAISYKNWWEDFPN